MISKSTSKYIKSLQLKKYRKKAQSFLVEGAKSVLELADTSFEVTHLMVTEPFLKENERLLSKFHDKVHLVSTKQLSSLGTLKTNVSGLAVVVCLPNVAFPISENDYVIALDRIRDPGNLGTIFRIADWYGFNKILCSPGCSDLYHPKVIQASMGSFTRVQVYYGDLKEHLRDHQMVYGAATDGEDLHQIAFGSGGIILIGNESQGLSDELLSLVKRKVGIPRFGKAESLNAAVATAVICDNIRRCQS